MKHSPLPLIVSSALVAVGLFSASALDDRPLDRFRQLDEVLPTPNDQRAASGAPGAEYWQQKVDYAIDVALDETENRITGREHITYHNQSPDTLSYLWVQIDPNLISPASHGALSQLAPELTSMAYGQMHSILHKLDFDGSCTIIGVTDGAGEDLPHTINDTMMRVDLPEPLVSGASTSFHIGWTYLINHSKRLRARTGYEEFADGTRLYEIAQWFPRLCAYTDYAGWQNKQFVGSGEFTLEFGDYQVNITVPNDHVVASTGELQNPDQVLEPIWRERLASAWEANEPTMIVTPDEAAERTKGKPTGTKTWQFHAKNVRDFAWASSRRFAWDALGVDVKGTGRVWAMSYFPPEGEPLWSRYSTHAVAHTLDVFSEHAIPYPYPVAISVNGPVGGMEYPMICFNGPRPNKDGTYSHGTKLGLIGVIIHEVGHNWFPMIINSDERQWTWMDEGLNTFVQFLAEQSFAPDYPSRRGFPDKIVSFMASDDQVPIMTNSESLLQFGNNAYAKPATALNILRETVMGRELFDFSFREYCRRWAFKRPEPADLFRTMEDASAVDLDWFWRGWFYTTDKVDQSISGLTRWTVTSQDPEIENEIKRAKRDENMVSLTRELHAESPKRSDRFPRLLDFYSAFDELDVTPADTRRYEALLKNIKEEDRGLLALPLNFYELELEDLGGVPMPVHIRVHYTDGTDNLVQLPAQIWQSNSLRVSKLLVTEGTIERLELDPLREMADADRSNNHWPRRIEEGRIQLRSRGKDSKNPMRRALDEIEREEKEAPEKEDGAKEDGAKEDGAKEDGAKEPDQEEG